MVPKKNEVGARGPMLGTILSIRPLCKTLSKTVISICIRLFDTCVIIVLACL